MVTKHNGVENLFRRLGADCNKGGISNIPPMLQPSPMGLNAPTIELGQALIPC